MSPSRLKHRTQWKCRYKRKLTMEEAAERFSKYDFPDMNVYLCPCGYVHFGHEPQWLKAKAAHG